MNADINKGNNYRDICCFFVLELLFIAYRRFNKQLYGLCNQA